MKRIFKKIMAFLMESNHYKHLIGGFAVGMLAFNPWAALYAGTIAASCLEFKDAVYGNKWDWTDWAVTIAGALVASIFWRLV